MSSRLSLLNLNVPSSLETKTLGWGEILQNNFQPEVPLNRIEHPQPIDLSSHHLHDHVLKEVQQTFSASVDLDHVMEHKYPVVIQQFSEPVINDNTPVATDQHTEILQKFADMPEHRIEPIPSSVETYGAGLWDPIQTSFENSSLALNRELAAEPNSDFNHSEGYLQALTFDPSKSDFNLSDNNTNDNDVVNVESHMMIPREAQEAVHVGEHLLIAKRDFGFPGLLQEQSSFPSLLATDNEDGLGFKLDQDIRHSDEGIQYLETSTSSEEDSSHVAGYDSFASSGDGGVNHYSVAAVENGHQTSNGPHQWHHEPNEYKHNVD